MTPIQRLTVVMCVLLVSASHAAAQNTGVFDRVGIGTSSPGEALHVDDGNILLEGSAEQELRVLRSFDGTGVSGPFLNPIFRLGRIIAGGDGDPEFRVLYSDDMTAERPVLEFDRKGIVASVGSGRGSHFEGFLNPGDSQPVFRLNSYPDMQLELGAGGSQATDTFIRRCGARCVTFPGAAVAAGTITADDVFIRIVRGARNVRPLAVAEAIQAVRRLDPVVDVDGDAGSAGRVGFQGDSLSAAIGDGDREQINPMEIVAVLTKVVQDQQRRIDALERQISGPGLSLGQTAIDHRADSRTVGR